MKHTNVAQILQKKINLPALKCRRIAGDIRGF